MPKENKSDKFLKQNNELRRKLTKENESYYTDLLVYLRTAGLFYKEEEVELRLVEILHDILEAQAAGISAHTYFGEEPQIIADQLISNFPKAGIRGKIKTFAMIFGISSLFTLLGQLISDSNQLNLLPFLLNALIILIGIQSFFWFMHSNIYSQRAEDKGKTNLIIIFIYVLLLGLFVGAQFLQPVALFFAIPNFILVGITLILPILFTGFTFFGKEKWRSLMLAMLPFVWVISSVYLFQKFNVINFRSDNIGKYGLAIVLFLSTFWSQFILFLESKKEH